jgi:hypothetical protein
MTMLEKPLAEQTVLPEHDLMLFAGTPVVFHCHHFNLFWDQTIDDALGSELGTRVRTEAARDAFHDLLSGLCQALGLDTPHEKLRVAHDVFAGMGQGRLTLEVGRDGGSAAAFALHASFAWQEKYGRSVRRKSPTDALAAGFAAAAAEVAHGLLRESMECRETECVATRDLRCAFELTRGKQAARIGSFRRAEVEGGIRASFRGLHEDEIQSMARRLRERLGSMKGDERGLLQAFGLFMALNASTYYNRTGYEAYRHLMMNTPRSVPVLKALLRESGHVCVFNTFGGILTSPEWEGLVGPLRGGVEEIISGCMAIARAAGFGHWVIEDLVPSRRLVLRTPSSYEAVYYRAREGRSQEGACFFHQGATLAVMQLAHRVPWTKRPELTPDFYSELFGAGLPWSVEETHCVSKGDAFCEFVVTKIE